MDPQTPPGRPDPGEAAKQLAARDRDALARLRASGRVQRRDGRFELLHPDVARPFVRDIERRAAAFRPGADTIRPKAKKSRKRR